MISQKISSTHRESIGDIIPHIVQTACAFKSVITFEVNDKRVNAKSIMGVMALASQDYLRSERQESQREEHHGSHGTGKSGRTADPRLRRRGR